MMRASRGGGSSYGSPSGGGHGIRGVFSFLGIVLILAATFSQSGQAHIGGFLACVFAALAGMAAYWAAYRAKGGIGMVAGICVPALSAYALFALSGEGAGWFWPAALFVAVGIDQALLKRREEK